MLLTDFFFSPSSFEFRLRVSLAADGSLALISRIRNVNGKPFSFSFAYHTYLSVSDIRYIAGIHFDIVLTNSFPFDRIEFRSTF